MLYIKKTFSASVNTFISTSIIFCSNNSLSVNYTRVFSLNFKFYTFRVWVSKPARMMQIDLRLSLDALKTRGKIYIFKKWEARNLLLMQNILAKKVLNYFFNDGIQKKYTCKKFNLKILFDYKIFTSFLISEVSQSLRNNIHFP